jgi:glycosyltransferase involved in cell wall biosynthesis
LWFLGNDARRIAARYVATLHGSYEVSAVTRPQLERFFGYVQWVYLTERNLHKFRELGFDTSQARHVPNGLVRRCSPNPVKRSSLGVSEESIVFMFVARSHPRKGWREAALAFAEFLRREEDVDAYLIMAGEGEETARVRNEFGDNPRIKVLGFRSDIDDLLELADFALVPSRFPGESMPLIVIQSILASVPIIAADVGHIGQMLTDNNDRAGLLIPATEDDDVFAADLGEAMSMAARGQLRVRNTTFKRIARKYRMATCVDRYLEIYGIARQAKNPIRKDIVQKNVVNSRKRRSASTRQTQNVGARRRSDGTVHRRGV